MFTVIFVTLLWLVLGWLLYIIIRKKKISLSLPQVLFFFGCKVIAGAAYGYIFKRFYNGDDTWGLHHDSLLQYQRLLHTPATFIAEVFSTSPLHAAPEFYFRPSGYLENLEYSIVTKLLALFNVISQGNYYINVVLFNFLCFWGLYFLYRLVAAVVAGACHKRLAFILFLFPPAVFWLSGIRAEGLLLLFTGVLMYQFKRWLTEKRTVTGVTCVACFALIFILRNGFALLLLPPLFAWWLHDTKKAGIKKLLIVVYSFCLAFVIAGSFFLPPRLNAFAVIAQRQHEFMLLKGNTRFNLTVLDNSTGSYIKVLPEAIANTAIRPFLWEATGLLQWFAALENITVLVLILYTLFISARKGNKIVKCPLLWVLVAVALSNYLLTGYIVPFPGAIVRYKIIPELLLIAACLIAIFEKREYDTN